jgi:PAS domain S-box-containing protein
MAPCLIAPSRRYETDDARWQAAFQNAQTHMSNLIRVLLVEDNSGDARLLREAVAEVRGPEFEWVTVDRLGEGLRRLREERFDVVLLDLSLPDAHGFDTFARAAEEAPTLPIVVLTGLDDEELAVRTVQAGAQDYLVKAHVDGHLLVRAIRYAIERRRSTHALEESERRFRAIFDQTFQFMGLLSPDGVLLEANQAALEYVAAAPADVLGQPFWETPWWSHDPELKSWVREAVAEAASGKFVRREVGHRGADGLVRSFDFSLKPVLDESGRVALLIPEGRDISVRKRAEEERDRLLMLEREKSEQLKLSVREAHHRIKNNLQSISDLLYLELASGDETTAEDALRESIHRIQAIATVHDLLSQDEDVRVVDARMVLERLVPMVLRSGGLSMCATDVEMDVASVPLSSKRATALALIVNELVSNAVKHACKTEMNRKIWLSLRQDSEDLVLRVRDNGPGLPADFDLRRDSHVGLDVVRTLAERDLNGCFSLKDEGGVLAEVRFVW